MKVLMFSWEYPPVVVGGLGWHVHGLAEALVAQGHEVTVVTRAAPLAAEPAEPGGTGGGPADAGVARAGPAEPGDFGTEPAEPAPPGVSHRHGVRIVRVAQDPPLVPFDELLAWTMALGHSMTRAALAVTRDWSADVVHAHDWLVTHPATTLKEHLGTPLVATLHATEAGRHQGWLPGPLNRAIHTVEWWLTFEARRVLTCSAAMQQEVTRLFELPPDKVDVVPNGIVAGDWVLAPRTVAAARSSWAPAGPLVVYAGRLEYEKGVHTLLAAIPSLRRRHPQLRVVVAGTGTHLERLRAQARELRLGRAVSFAGFLPRPQLAALLAAADVAVVPSIYEPFGMVALEAAAAGAPLVVSATGGLREIVDDRVTGLLVTPERPRELAQAVHDLLSDEVRARRLARRAGERVLREHAWAAVAARTAEAYRRAVVEERELANGPGGAVDRLRRIRLVAAGENLLAPPATGLLP